MRSTISFCSQAVVVSCVQKTLTTVQGLASKMEVTHIASTFVAGMCARSKARQTNVTALSIASRAALPQVGERSCPLLVAISDLITQLKPGLDEGCVAAKSLAFAYLRGRSPQCALRLIELDLLLVEVALGVGVQREDVAARGVARQCGVSGASAHDGSGSRGGVRTTVAARAVVCPRR